MSAFVSKGLEVVWNNNGQKNNIYGIVWTGFSIRSYLILKGLFSIQRLTGYTREYVSYEWMKIWFAYSKGENFYKIKINIIYY